jgi:hypothetical protein
VQCLRLSQWLGAVPYLPGVACETPVVPVRLLVHRLVTNKHQLVHTIPQPGSPLGILKLHLTCCACKQAELVRPGLEPERMAGVYCEGAV